jgi:hypothetical protein
MMTNGQSRSASPAVVRRVTNDRQSGFMTPFSPL